MIYNHSIALTEADADEFLESVGVELYENYAVINNQLIPGHDAESILEAYDIFLYDDHIVLEGQQAEEYLARKQAAIDAERKEIERRYGKTYKYNIDHDKTHDKGTRTGQTPTWQVNPWRGARDEEKYSQGTKTHDYVSRNPAFKKVEERRARMEELKKKYPDAMPKNTKNALDDKYDKAKSKRQEEIRYADSVARRFTDKNASGHRHGEYQVGTPEYDMATDAARRHYRRTHKNEAAEIFSSIKFI